MLPLRSFQIPSDYDRVTIDLASLVMRHVRVADSSAGGGEDQEHRARQERSSQRQVHEELPRVGAGLREEAVEHVAVTEGQRQEHHHREQRVHAVQHPQPVSPQVLQHPAALLPLRPVVVEHVHPPQGGHPVVQLAVAALEAVGEGEGGAGGGAELYQGGGEVLVRGVAHAPVGEGRGERLEGQHGAAGQELHQVRRARQRLVDHHHRRLLRSFLRLSRRWLRRHG
ncbi:hypothetical protein B296_00024469 [Ensete ventricosum]|uniref:Uncharacterized protein n=1 Tax=Ensete ventricosum TaxID=4639 RepID=A0A426ZBR8_ENSVE|nr:hypothetical protein B296_00024469 [Ensete ventricosum]